MNRSRSQALIRQHRWWLSRKSDYAVARRAEHAYADATTMMTGLAMVCTVPDNFPLVRLLLAAGLLVFAAFCHRRRRQFARIRQDFEDRWPQNFSDLDAPPHGQTQACHFLSPHEDAAK